jgi:hypothetical protein
VRPPTDGLTQRARLGADRLVASGAIMSDPLAALSTSPPATSQEVCNRLRARSMIGQQCGHQRAIWYVMESAALHSWGSGPGGAHSERETYDSRLQQAQTQRKEEERGGHPRAQRQVAQDFSPYTKVTRVRWLCNRCLPHHRHGRSKQR